MATLRSQHDLGTVVMPVFIDDEAIALTLADGHAQTQHI